MSRSPCVRCGHLLQLDDPTAPPRVIVSLRAEELIELAMRTENGDTWNRLACALGLIDAKAERALRARAIAGLAREFEDVPTSPGVS